MGYCYCIFNLSVNLLQTGLTRVSYRLLFPTLYKSEQDSRILINNPPTFYNCSLTQSR